MRSLLLLPASLGAFRNREIKHPLVGLTEEGVLTHALGQSVFVPWEPISAIREIDLRGNPYLAFDVSDPTAIRRRGGSRVLGMLEAPLLGHDHAVSPVGVGIEPDAFAQAGV